MRHALFPGLAALGAFLAGANVSAAETKGAPLPATEVDEKAWSFEASGFWYVLPDERDYLQPTFTADQGWAHLEARYNYEGLKSGSAWGGYNLSFGREVQLDLTPMLGIVFGDTAGIAPGYRGSLAWWKLELSSEGEYLFDTRTWSDGFFYTWSELALAPMDWFRLGLVVQRTKVYQTDFDIQRGFLAGVAYMDATFTTYLFNPDASPPTVVLAFSLGF